MGDSVSPEPQQAAATEENNKKHVSHPNHGAAAQAAVTKPIGKTIQLSQEEYDRLVEQAKQAQQRHDEYLRAVAEFENTKKRLHREKEEFVKYAAEAIVRDLLPIVDSLDQALVAVDPSAPPHPAPGCGVARDFPTRQAGEGAGGPAAGLRKQSDIEAILKGIQLIHRQLLGLLEKEGVKRIPTVGEVFDPHRHEAVAQVDAQDGVKEQTVMEEVQVGYTMHGKVIRPAMVKVAKKSSPQSTVDSPQNKANHEGNA